MYIMDSSQYNHMDKIIDGLYLGNIQAASNMIMLKKKGITHILQVAAGFKPFFQGEFNYMVINILDMPFENIMRHFKPGVDFIKKAIQSGGTVLVHCFAGISRSASVVIAYLMRELGLPMLDAMTYTRKKRPIVFPNPGFQKQLFEYEKHLRQNNQKNMIEYHEKKKQKIKEVERQAPQSAFTNSEKIIRLAQESKRFADIQPIRSPQPQSDDNRLKFKHLSMIPSNQEKPPLVTNSATVKQTALAKLLTQAHQSQKQPENNANSASRPQTTHQISKKYQREPNSEKRHQPSHQSNFPTVFDLHGGATQDQRGKNGQESSLQRHNTADNYHNDNKKQGMSSTIKPQPSINPLGIGGGFNVIESSYKRDYSLKQSDIQNLNVKRVQVSQTPQKPKESSGQQNNLFNSNNHSQAISQQYFYQNNNPTSRAQAHPESSRGQYYQKFESITRDQIQHPSIQKYHAKESNTNKDSANHSAKAKQSVGGNIFQQYQVYSPQQQSHHHVKKEAAASLRSPQPSQQIEGQKLDKSYSNQANNYSAGPPANGAQIQSFDNRGPLPQSHYNLREIRKRQ